MAAAVRHSSRSRASAGARLLTLNGDGSGTLADAARDKPGPLHAAERGADDLAALLYTSGTTGRSKGAMLTHDNLLSNAEALVATWRFTADDVLLHALPIFHTHGLFVASNVMLLAGGSMIFLPALDVDDLVASMAQATTMMGVPTFYTRLLADPRLDRALVAHMRLFVSGSAPLLAETHVEFEARTGHRILERYGMTETNMNTSNPYDGERRAGTVGLPLPGVEVRVADAETGQGRRATAGSASSRCAAATSSRATGTCRRRPRRNFARTASSSPATSARSTPTAMSRSSAAPRTW